MDGVTGKVNVYGWMLMLASNFIAIHSVVGKIFTVKTQNVNRMVALEGRSGITCNIHRLPTSEANFVTG